MPSRCLACLGGAGDSLDGLLLDKCELRRLTWPFCELSLYCFQKCLETCRVVIDCALFGKQKALLHPKHLGLFIHLIFSIAVLFKLFKSFSTVSSTVHSSQVKVCLWSLVRMLRDIFRAKNKIMLSGRKKKYEKWDYIFSQSKSSPPDKN